jgi:hypothetical protein
MRGATLVAAGLGALGLLACLGPYPNIGERLDVGSRVSGTSYISVDAGAARILVLAPLDGGQNAPFTRVDEFQPRAVETLQGSWSGGAADVSFSTSTVFTLPEESAKPVSSRRGATRQTLSPPRLSAATLVAVSPEALELAGPAEVAGSYHTLVSRTASISGADPTSPACAFHIANLAVESSEARIPGFNSPGLTQYLNREEPFVGILSGTVTIGLVGLFSPVSTITFANYADFEGVVLNGVQISSTNTSGDGALSGVLHFRIDRAGLPALEGSVDYGEVRLTGGNESGDYLVTLDAGPATRVPTGHRIPSLEECLAL